MLDIESEVLDYVRLLIKQYATKSECIEDENGTSFYYIDYTATLQKFINRVEQNEVEPPFSRNEFLANDDIIETVEGFKMSVDTFWYALLFIYDYVQGICEDCLGSQTFQSPHNQMQALMEYLQKYPKAEIMVNNAGARKSEALVIGGGKMVTEHIVCAIAEHFKAMDGIDPDIQYFRSSFKMNQHIISEPDTKSANIKMTLVVRMYSTLFELLNLPNKQSKDGGTVSYNRMLLVSRIVYLYRYKDNESYLIDDDNLKKAIKDHKDKKIHVPLTAIY